MTNDLSPPPQKSKKEQPKKEKKKVRRATALRSCDLSFPFLLPLTPDYRLKTRPPSVHTCVWTCVAHTCVCEAARLLVLVLVLHHHLRLLHSPFLVLRAVHVLERTLQPLLHDLFDSASIRDRVPSRRSGRADGAHAHGSPEAGREGEESGREGEERGGAWLQYIREHAEQHAAVFTPNLADLGERES